MVCVITCSQYLSSEQQTIPKFCTLVTYKTRQFIIISNTDWLCSGGSSYLDLSCGCSQKVAQVAVRALSVDIPQICFSCISFCLFFVSPRGFSSVTDSGDISFGGLDLQSCVSPKRWRPISFVASEAMQSHFHSHYWSGPSQKLSGSRNVADSFC